VGRTAGVVIGVVAVISALTLVTIGVVALVHSLHHNRQPPVVTVTTSS
jgi:uncharacterized membrane protein